MSVVTYGDVTLQITHTKFDVRPERTQDGADLLCYKATLTVDFIFNPLATSYTGTATAPMFLEGLSPAESMAILKQYLMTPRRQLQYATVSTDGLLTPLYILQAPADGITSDVMTGPTPLSCDITLLGITKTWRGRWVVETYLLDCPPPYQYLISNRYETTHTINEHYFTAITTKGTAVFRMDALEAGGYVADQFRNVLFPPIPLGFKRTNAQVTVNTIGNVLMYSCTDTEQQYSLGTTQNSKFRLGVQKFNARMTTGHAPFDANSNNALTTMTLLSVQVLGDKTASRANLESFAAQMVVAKLQVVAGPIDPTKNSLIRRVEITEMFDSDGPPAIQMTAEAQLPASNLAPAGVGTLNSSLLGVDALPFLANDGNSPQLPNDSNTRGYFYGVIVAQQLQGMCMAVPAPGDFAVSGGSKGSGIAAISNDPPPDGYIISTSVSDTPPPQFYNSYNTAASNLGPWTEAKIDVKYTYDPGVRFGMISETALDSAGGGGSSGGGGGGGTTQSPTQTVEVMTLSQPVSFVVYNGTMERLLTPPSIPDPNIADTNLVLYDSEQVAAAPELAPDGQTLIWRASFTYKYVMLNSQGPKPTLKTAALPWMTTPFANTTIYESSYAGGIIDGGSGTGGSLGGGNDSGGNG